MEIAAIIASVVSVIIGLLAIALSAFFFKMSFQNSESIKNNVTKLEAIFEKLYSGMFGMLSDTHTQMMQHVFSSDEFEDQSVNQQKKGKQEI